MALVKACGWLRNGYFNSELQKLNEKPAYLNWGWEGGGGNMHLIISHPMLKQTGFHSYFACDVLLGDGVLPCHFLKNQHLSCFLY